MVEIDEDILIKLKKDADDNKQIVRIVRMIIAAVFVLIFYFSFGLNWMNLQLEKQRSEIQNQIAITQAHNNVMVKQIESEGLSIEEYFKWLEVRDGR